MLSGLAEELNDLFRVRTAQERYEHYGFTGDVDDHGTFAGIKRGCKCFTCCETKRRYDWEYERAHPRPRRAKKH